MLAVVTHPTRLGTLKPDWGSYRSVTVAQLGTYREGLEEELLRQGDTVVVLRREYYNVCLTKSGSVGWLWNEDITEEF